MGVDGVNEVRILLGRRFKWDGVVVEVRMVVAEALDDSWNNEDLSLLLAASVNLRFVVTTGDCFDMQDIRRPPAAANVPMGKRPVMERKGPSDELLFSAVEGGSSVISILKTKQIRYKQESSNISRRHLCQN